MNNKIDEINVHQEKGNRIYIESETGVVNFKRGKGKV